MGMSGSFKIVRTPASYIISWIVHGKLEKKGSFHILANYSDAKFLKRYPDNIWMCHMKADVLEIPKMW